MFNDACCFGNCGHPCDVGSVSAQGWSPFLKDDPAPMVGHVVLFLLAGKFQRKQNQPGPNVFYSKHGEKQPRRDLVWTHGLSLQF